MQSGTNQNDCVPLQQVLGEKFDIEISCEKIN